MRVVNASKELGMYVTMTVMRYVQSKPVFVFVVLIIERGYVLKVITNVKMHP